MARLDELAFDYWWKTAGQSLVGVYSHESIAWAAFSYAISMSRDGVFDPEPKPDPCAGGFCPVELFRPIDETEGSN